MNRVHRTSRPLIGRNSATYPATLTAVVANTLILALLSPATWSGSAVQAIRPRPRGHQACRRTAKRTCVRSRVFAQARVSGLRLRLGRGRASLGRLGEAPRYHHLDATCAEKHGMATLGGPAATYRVFQRRGAAGNGLLWNPDLGLRPAQDFVRSAARLLEGGGGSILCKGQHSHRRVLAPRVLKRYWRSRQLPEKLQVVRKGEYERMPVVDPKNYVMRPRVLRQGRPETGPHEERNIYCLAVSPDDKRFVAGGGDVFGGVSREYSGESSVTVWDIATGRRMFDIGDEKVPILRFCLSPNGRALYTCGDKVLGWDAVKSAPPIQQFDASGRRMISIAVSPDGTMLAAGGLEGTVVIWHIDSAARLATLTHHGGPVYTLAFSPASRKLAAAGERGVATVWDIELLPGKHN